MRKFAGKKDILLLLGLLLFALGALFFFTQAKKPGKTAVVELGGEAVLTISLEEDQVFSLPQRPGVSLEVKAGRCAFVHSNCPDKTCVKTGFISQPGQFAACLPNQMVLRILPLDGETHLDAVTG